MTIKTYCDNMRVGYKEGSKEWTNLYCNLTAKTCVGFKHASGAFFWDLNKIQGKVNIDDIEACPLVQGTTIESKLSKGEKNEK